MSTGLLKSAFSARGITFLIVSWGLPVLVAAGAWWIVAYPAWSDIPKFDLISQRLADSKLSGLTIFIVCWAVVSLGLGLNARTFFRLLEGYHVRPRRLAERRAAMHWYHRENLRLAEAFTEVEGTVSRLKEQLAKLPAQDTGLPAATQQLERAKAKLTEIEEESRKAADNVRRRLLPVRRRYTLRPCGTLDRWRDYPSDRRHILPTKLGNRIRSFERYGNYRYGLDVLILWYEFVAASKDDLLAEIEASRQKVEIFVAATVVAMLFAIATAFPLLFDAARQGRTVALACSVGGALFLSAVFYRKAVAETWDWERSVVALVNTARADVAKSFGLALPGTIAEEKKAWQTIAGFVQLGSQPYIESLDELRVKYPLPALTSAAQRVLDKF